MEITIRSTLNEIKGLIIITVKTEVIRNKSSSNNIQYTKRYKRFTFNHCGKYNKVYIERNKRFDYHHYGN